MVAFQLVKNIGDSDIASVFISDKTGMSRNKIKDAMNKGALWIQRGSNNATRIRRASFKLMPGDRLSLYYDESLLAIEPPAATCLHDLKRYSVWNKPQGLLSQGTQYGDHCSLMRQAELFFKPMRQVFLIHRLDREASGLVLLAHSREAAAKLSRMFAQHEITKTYEIVVLGNLTPEAASGVIDTPLDGKPAITTYDVIEYDPASNTSSAAVKIKTGRMHQIRRHFDGIGHPVMGDPRYGRGNKNTKGLQLAAVELEFQCPFSKKWMKFQMPSSV